MLHVLLLILKTAGIIILAAAVLLLLFLYIFFLAAVPWKIHTERKEKVKVAVSVRWLLGILVLRYSLDEAQGWEQDLHVKLFGLWAFHPFGDKWLEDPKTRRMGKWFKKKLFRRGKQPSGDRKPTMADTPKEPSPDDAGAPPPEPAPHGAGPFLASRENTAPGPKTLPAQGSRPRRRKRRKKLFYAIRDFCDKIKQICKRILHMGDTVHKLAGQKDKLFSVWNLEENKKARSVIREECSQLWKKAGPKKVRGTVRFGFGDPSDTGLCMGFASMFCAWYPKGFYIFPDFENEVLEWDIRARGRARGYVLLRFLWRMFTDESLRHLYRYLERF